MSEMFGTFALSVGAAVSPQFFPSHLLKDTSLSESR